MRHDIRLKGYRFELRPLAMSDARFIVEMRTDPEIGRFIHPTSKDLRDQEAWIEDYDRRAGDWTFILSALDTGRSHGAFSIYHHDAETYVARIGRWLAPCRCPYTAEFALLGYTVAFEHLGLRRVYARIPKMHDRALSFQRAIGSRCCGPSGERAELASGPQPLIEYELDRAAWATAQIRLRDLAQRAAARAVYAPENRAALDCVT